MNTRTIDKIYSAAPINIIPGVRGQRAFPTASLKNTSPFIMLDHIGPGQVGSDFLVAGDGHPHRGFETITFMFEGEMDHLDSLGNRAELKSGSVQRMNAGKGIVHGGDMRSDPDTGVFHEVQLWVNVPAKDKWRTPDIHNLSTQEIPSIKEDQYEFRVLSGEINGVKGPLKTLADTKIGHLISNGSKVQLGPFNSGYRVLLYVLKGAVSIANKTIQQFEVAELSSDSDYLELITEENVELLVMAGIPLDEPVVMGGPFVMNTEAEINEAYSDYRKGVFGKLKHS